MRSTGVFRVDSSAEERLVGVDVAHAGENALVQQSRLDGHLVRLRKASRSVRQSKPGPSGSGPSRPMTVCRSSGSRAQARPKRRTSTKCRAGSRSKASHQAGMRLDVASAGRRWTLPLIIKCRASTRSVRRSSRYLPRRSISRRHAVRPAGLRTPWTVTPCVSFGSKTVARADGSVYDVGIQLAADRFNFWQLRHNRETMGMARVRRATQHANRTRPVKSPGR